MAKALLDLDVSRAYVVSSHDGMDEISLSSTTSFAYVESDRISEAIIDPEVYGFKRAPKEAILGGNAEDNAEIVRSVLSGEERGPKRDIVILNAMFALFVDGKVRDLQEAKETALDAIESGKAAAHMQYIAEVSQKLG
jgi:anthranilate phosphoribosyltransferase